MKNLPPVERRADGSLYHMDGKQRRETVRLIKGLCSYYDNGNCLYLDRGEAVTCPQSNSYSVCCKFFRHVLLKDQEGKGLEAGIFQREALKRCAVCGKPFSSTSNSAKYCGDCKAAVQRQQKAGKSGLFSPQTDKSIRYHSHPRKRGSIFLHRLTIKSQAPKQNFREEF